MPDKEIIRRFIVSLLFCETGGDIIEAIDRTAELAGIDLPEHYTCAELQEALGPEPGLWHD